MNAKYAPKPNLNPNEPNTTWPKPPCFGVTQSGRQAVLNFDFCILIFDFENVFQAFSQNKPNFFTTKYALSISKTQKWRPKTYPKKRNEPICG